jgi:hypothetical protein
MCLPFEWSKVKFVLPNVWNNTVCFEDLCLLGCDAVSLSEKLHIDYQLDALVIIYS